MRLRSFGFIYLSSKVSIHASVKDATSKHLNTLKILSFNPRICKRCDFLLYNILTAIQVSIHASVKDATYALWRWYGWQQVSIHASVKDATWHDKKVKPKVGVSIHASVKDATVRETDAKVNLSVSIHASVKDATLLLRLPIKFWAKVSIHASVKDATPCLWKALLMTLLNCNFANDKVEKQ